MGLSEPCTGAGGFTAARQWEYGVFAWTASSLAFRELAVAVGHTGLCLNIFGPDPVQHFFERKSVRVDGSFIVGTTDAEPCMDQVPNHCPSICSTPDAAKLGIMMSTFSKKRGKMDGTVPWHRRKYFEHSGAFYICRFFAQRKVILLFEVRSISRTRPSRISSANPTCAAKKRSLSETTNCRRTPCIRIISD